MKIHANTGGLAHTNAFLIVDESTKKAVLFDAPDHTVGALMDIVEEQQLELIGLWLTHGHFDHVADHKVVADRFPGTKVMIHNLDEPKLLKPGSRIVQLPFNIPPGKADGFLEDGQTLELGKLKFKVIFTPGHSPGHVSFYNAEENLLIGGDLIIGGAVGRTDLPDSNEKDLIESVKRVMQLPPETILLPGHGDPSTLADEQRDNGYVRRFVRG